MNKEEIKQRYRETVLPETKSPYHFEVPDEASIELSAYNPMCGDKYKLYLEGPGDLQNMHYHGIGCALSKASGSMMIRALEKMTIHDAIRFVRAFIDQVESGQADASLPEDLRVFVELKNFEGREECMTLTWKALLKHLESQTQQ